MSVGKFTLELGEGIDCRIHLPAQPLLCGMEGRNHVPERGVAHDDDVDVA